MGYFECNHCDTGFTSPGDNLSACPVCGRTCEKSLQVGETPSDGICEELISFSVGHPHAKIPWPHRILHRASDHIKAQDKRIAELESELVMFTQTGGAYAEIIKERDKRIMAEAERDALREDLLLLCREIEQLNATHPQNTEAMIHQWQRLFFALDNARAALALFAGKE